MCLSTTCFLKKKHHCYANLCTRVKGKKSLHGRGLTNCSGFAQKKKLTALESGFDGTYKLVLRQRTTIRMTSELCWHSGAMVVATDNQERSMNVRA
jgi:hypothetical protein